MSQKVLYICYAIHSQELLNLLILWPLLGFHNSPGNSLQVVWLSLLNGQRSSVLFKLELFLFTSALLINTPIIVLGFFKKLPSDSLPGCQVFILRLHQLGSLDAATTFIAHTRLLG